MTFDVSTLTFAGGIVAFASGLFLLLHWWQARDDRAALVWGTAGCGMGVGISILALQGVLPDYASVIVAPLSLDVCSAGMWAAARIFNRGSIRWRPVFSAVAAWIAILALIGATGHEYLAASLGLGISACLYAAGAFEFWRTRGERLRGRWPMIILVCLMAVALFISAGQVAIFFQLPSISRLGIIHFVGLVYTGGSAMFLVTMLKDRSEIKHKAAALEDPLTGIANRRGFMDRARRSLERCLHDGAPFSLLAFDLDRFKKVNDTFGHPTGDQVLRIFADALSRTVRPADVVGRIGGEEFALALPDCNGEGAVVVAGRIRVAFQNDARFVNGQSVGATVSAGIASAPEHGESLDDLFANADSALYRAKELGRNRVLRASHNAADGDSTNVVRIA